MKGILLAGGLGTRLYPITKGINKHLVPVYDKPMIYYPLSVLLLAGITEILIISTPRDLPMLEHLLQGGSQWGVSLTYKEQTSPGGLSEAFLLAEDFLQGDSVCFALGDNVFYGQGFVDILLNARRQIESGDAGACVFGYLVNDPERYGVVKFDEKKNVLSIVEKPKQPQSNYAVTGLYFYDGNVVEYAKQLTPSERGELEITDLNNRYLKEKRLKVELLGRGFAWLDMGTHDSLLNASHYISTVENRQGLKVGCLEEVAWLKGYITTEQLLQEADKLEKTGYGQYLKKIAGVA